MEKLNCKIGDDVVVIEDGKLRYGVVKNVFEELNPPIYIVEFENGTEKVPYNRVAPAPKKATPEEQKSEPVVKSEITITPEKFQEIAIDVIDKETEDFPIVSMACTILIVKIHKALFVDDWE